MSKSEGQSPLLVVVGFGPGLGDALSEVFGNAGYRVVGLSRHASTNAKNPHSQEALATGLVHRQCDASDPDSVGTCLKEIIKDHGAPDVVIYNPMQLQIRPFLEVSPEEFESVWRVTCFGAMLVAREVLPPMIKAGSGTLIFTGATASIRGSAKFSSLATSKFGLRGLAQSLAREFGPQGIHVAHTILDGLIWSPQTIERFSPDEGSCMSPAAIAKNYLDVAQQHTSAWTHELDMRPFAGNF